MINAGDLDRQIRIQARTSEKSPSGAETRTWHDAATVWAKITPVSGRESFAGQQRYAEVDTVFTIRIRNDFTPSPLNRILVGTVAYDIVEALALPGGRPDRVEIRATARADAAE